MSRLSFAVRLELLPTDRGGRAHPIVSDYRPHWDLSNTWDGARTLNDGRVLLDGVAELAPGTTGVAHVEPLVEALWGAVDVGAVLPMLEGKRLVGHATVLEVKRPEHFTRETAAFANQAAQFDVGRGLDLWDSAAPRAAAIWEWRFHFDHHWGDHAVDALRALHRACLD